ncbi:MAG: hypothetical protein ACPGR8_15320 [Limisphaerales bacterium]
MKRTLASYEDLGGAAQQRPLPVAALHYLLNILHACQTKYPASSNLRSSRHVFPLGLGTSRRAWGQEGGKAFGKSQGRTYKPPPSVAESLLKLTVNPSYESQLALVQFGEHDEPRKLVAAAVASAEAVPNISPAARIPVSGALHESKQLYYNRPGAPECACGPECLGARLPGSPGTPLKVYQTPAEAAEGVYPPAPAFCLLCLRADAAALAKTLSAVVAGSEAGLYKAALVLPPFQNKVGVPDGYKQEYLGVSPQYSTFVFTPISIVGAHPELLTVEYDSGAKSSYVDQQALLACCPNPPLNSQALDSHPRQDSSAFSLHSCRGTTMTSAPRLATQSSRKRPRVNEPPVLTSLQTKVRR